ncbi:hypothetical protein SAY87_008777 [Trapa incisa]|uniref:Uncharacterized protein n=1 Tax=Trapa incisa TaxID=236973 RepID=A0AAN7JYR5_9MYRT|nr:hypothetical protein SAY87_008777 [Trapa incisa]
MKISMSCSCFSSSSKRRKSAPGSSNVIERHQLKDVTLISYSELKSATNNFHESSKIGRGGFGVVYQAWELYKKGDLLRLVDPKLEGQYPEEEVLRYMKVAFFCTQSALNRRPPMSLVVKMLSRNIKLNEKELTAPGFFQDSTQSSGQSSSKKSSADSTRVMTSVPITITEVSPR